MGMRRSRVTQADLARVLRAMKSVGVDARVDVRPDGTISIIKADVTGGSAAAPPVDDTDFVRL